MNDELVRLPGGSLQVSYEGEGPVTIVLLSGSGILFPALEYAYLADALAEHYSVLIPSKFGYGRSDLTQESRDVDTVVEEYRSALAALGHTGPLVLAAHSVSFLEALRWAQKYPEEVSALVGVDPATPAAYPGTDLTASSKQLEGLNHPEWKRRLIFAFFAKGLLNRYPAPLRRKLRPAAKQNFASCVWVNEARALPHNIQLVTQEGAPAKIPTLFLLSNGKDTIWPKEEWRKRALDYLSQFETQDSQLFDLPHDLYHYQPEELAQAIDNFLIGVLQPELLEESSPALDSDSSPEDRPSDPEEG